MNTMQFTYDAYRKLIYTLKEHNYQLTDYHHYKEVTRPCILRHDIDYSLDKAWELAKMEAISRVQSTYFVLLTSDFYNVFSKHSRNVLKNIAKLGHTIGLHFDEVTYLSDENKITEDMDYSLRSKQLIGLIQKEAEILSCALDLNVDTVSMHRPSKFCLECDLKIPGIINSYGWEFFKGFKYLSDSRRHWREDVLGYIREEKFERLHILTHAFWYHDTEINLNDTLTDYLERARQDRYDLLDRNFTRLNDALVGKDS